MPRNKKDNPMRILYWLLILSTGIVVLPVLWFFGIPFKMPEYGE